MKGYAIRTEIFLDDIQKELDRARNKFPGNTVQMMALSEEVGELANALLERRIGKATAEHVWEEAVQVAAMAIRVATEGDSSIPQYVPCDALLKRLAAVTS